MVAKYLTVIARLWRSGGAGRRKPPAPAPSVQSQFLELGLGGDAALVPAAQLVVLGQHLVEVVDLALGRAGLDGLLEQTLGQRVVGRGVALLQVCLLYTSD